MATDNFTRADETPLASPWATLAGSGVSLSSNTAVNLSAGDAASYRTDSSITDSQVKISVLGASDGGPLICGNASPFNAYITTCFTGSIELYRIDNGTFTSIASNVAIYAVNDTIRLRRSGANVIVSRNGTDIITFSDSTYTTGVDGIFAAANNLAFSQWTNNATAASPPMGRAWIG
jgi:hypothetical protein